MSRKCLLLLLLTFACTPSATAPAAASASSKETAGRELYERGHELARQGDSVRAEQYLAAALEAGHDPSETLPLLMRVCLLNSRLRAALNHAEPYLRQHPDAVWLRYLVATVYLGLRQPSRAREELLTIEAQAPNHARTRYLLGLTEWEGFGDERAAREHFSAYARLEPGGRYAAEVEQWLKAHPAERAADATPAPAPSPAPERSEVGAAQAGAEATPGAAQPARPTRVEGLRVAPRAQVAPEARSQEAPPELETEELRKP